MYKHIDFKEFASFANDYVRDVEAVSEEGFPKTAFSLTTHFQIAFDLLQVFLTPKGERNLTFSFYHAYSILTDRIGRATEVRELFDYEKQMISGMMRIFQVPKLKGREILADFEETMVYPPHVVEPINLLQKMGSEISHEMIGTLIQMPWFEILQRGFAKKEERATMALAQMEE